MEKLELPGPRVIIALLLVLLIIVTASPSSGLLGEEFDPLANVPIEGHLGGHTEPQLACTTDDSTTVEVNLTAQATEWQFTAGTTIDAWTFGNALPGPVLCADIGDRIEVNLNNELSVPVSFHVHLPAANGSSNPESVAPGAAATYAFTATTAGAYLYHDLANGNEGIGRGLYGVLIVRDSIPEVDHEIVVLMGEFQPAYHPDTYAAVINGKAFPWMPRWNFDTDERVRVYLVNAGPSEEHTFHIHGHRWLDADEGRPIDNKFLSPHSAVHHPELPAPEGFIPLANALAADVAVFEFNASAEGEWMYHCHVYDHINAGMMGHLTVGDVESYYHGEDAH